jgi:hypothetical protein
MNKFNKTIKAKLINTIIAKKYEKKYEKALDKLSKEIRKVMVKSSHHNEFKALNLSVEMLSAVQAVSAINIQYIELECVEFIRFTRSIQLSDPVYGYYGGRQIPEDFKPLMDLRELIKTVEREHIVLSSVIGLYTTVKKLINDLPWIEKHLPKESVKNKVMIPVDKLNEISETFGSL